MYVQLQTIEGSVFASDPVDWAQVGLTPPQVDEVLAELEDLLQNWQDAQHIGLEIGGRKRYFNPANVLWAEIVY